MPLSWKMKKTGLSLHYKKLRTFIFNSAPPMKHSIMQQKHTILCKEFQILYLTRSFHVAGRLFSFQ